LTPLYSYMAPREIAAGMILAATNGDLTTVTVATAMLLVFSNANFSNR